jgi:chromosome segregation ATPase
MADPNPTEVLDYLRERFNRVDTQLAEIRTDIRDVRERVMRLEREAAVTRRDIAGLHTDWVSLSGRLDFIDERLGRIERRLDLVSEER